MSPVRIFVPRDSAALAVGADEVASTLAAECTQRGLAVEIVRNGSRGLFWLEPLLEVATPAGRVAYGPVQAEDIPSLLDAGLLEGAAHALCHGPTDHIPYLARQERLTFCRMGVTDPLSLADYESHDGWSGLRRALELDGAAIVQQVLDSGLRGRGGAAFPAGIKWRTVLQADAPRKYVVCNADEGDSGTFSDRMTMEGDPYMLIEGMAIAGLAVGATMGYIYVRSEYPHAIATLTEAIARARAAGFIGDDVCGSGRAFHLEVRKAAGAYVCGEETAMLESIEGKRGIVRAKPPLPAVEGLFGQPTVINNVISLASVPIILARGAAFYRDYGTGRSRGTLPFQLAGNVRQGGLVEKAFGLTLRELLFDFGGGSRSGRPIKAVQVGGPLGAYVPESQWDLPLDYEAYAAVGAVVGHGGIVVHDDTADMAALARYAMEFCALESCGKCTPCRIGSTRGVEVIDRIPRARTSERSRSRPTQVALLRDLCDTMLHGSLCAMGGMTPYPVLSALNHYPADFGIASPDSLAAWRIPMLQHLKLEIDHGTPARESSETVTLSIDGYAVAVPKGTSLMRAAVDAGIKVPKLCATDSLEPFGSCRLCLVEIEGRKGFPASCTTPAENGMVVHTQTPKLQDLRKGVMELYISDHPLDCLTCRANGNCELQDMAGVTGLRNVRYGVGEAAGAHHTQSAKDESNPYFTYDPSKCIVCSRCVRACEETQGTFALTISGRGFDSRVSPGQDQPFMDSDCVSCGACIEACPTATLQEKSVIELGQPEHSLITTCAYCGVGCGFKAEMKGNTVVRMVPWKDGKANEGHSCVKGRFAWGYATHKDRITKPMIRAKITDPWQEVSWDEAIAHAAGEFKRIQAAHGQDAVGGITSSRCTNEETYLVQKLVRAAFGNNNVDTCARVCHSPTGYGLGQTFGTSAGTQTFKSVEHTDVMLDRLHAVDARELRYATGSRTCRRRKQEWDWNSRFRHLVVLFGDAGAAVVLRAGEDGPRGLIDHELHGAGRRLPEALRAGHRLRHLPHRPGAVPPRRPHPCDGRPLRVQDGDHQHGRGRALGAAEKRRAAGGAQARADAPGEQAHQRVLRQGARPARGAGAAQHPQVRQHDGRHDPAAVGRVRARRPAATGRPGAAGRLRRRHDLGCLSGARLATAARHGRAAPHRAATTDSGSADLDRQRLGPLDRLSAPGRGRLVAPAAPQADHEPGEGADADQEHGVADHAQPAQRLDQRLLQELGAARVPQARARRWPRPARGRSAAGSARPSGRGRCSSPRSAIAERALAPRPRAR